MTLINTISNIGNVSVSKSASISSNAQQSTGQSSNNVACGNCGGSNAYNTKNLVGGVFIIVGAFFNLFGNYFRGNSGSCGCGN